MAKTSAGLLVFRRGRGEAEVFLVHPGGLFWRSKDIGAWSIPKGELTPGEEPLSGAIREFEEETSFRLEGPFTALAPVRQSGGKQVFAWAVEGDCDAARIRSNLVTLRLRNKEIAFPEVDRAEWFTTSVAKEKLLSGQLPLLQQLERLLTEN